MDRFDKLLRIVELVIIEQLIRHFEEVGRQIEIVFSLVEIRQTSKVGCLCNVAEIVPVYRSAVIHIHFLERIAGQVLIVGINQSLRFCHRRCLDISFVCHCRWILIGGIQSHLR